MLRAAEQCAKTTRVRPTWPLLRAPKSRGATRRSELGTIWRANSTGRTESGDRRGRAKASRHPERWSCGISPRHGRSTIGSRGAVCVATGVDVFEEADAEGPEPMSRPTPGARFGAIFLTTPAPRAAPPEKTHPDRPPTTTPGAEPQGFARSPHEAAQGGGVVGAGGRRKRATQVAGAREGPTVNDRRILGARDGAHEDTLP